jgi:uncharacterized protein (TIGR02996 family)
MAKASTSGTSALLNAVLAAPDDDAPRLVYADALQTDGDLRGELIAVQCELARLGCEDSERLFLDWVGDALADDKALDDGRIAKLRQREGALLKKHGRAWAAAFVPSGLPAQSARFWRGFVEHVGWDAQARSAGSLDAVMKRTPITSLMPTGAAKAKDLAAFLGLPALDRIQSIYNGSVCEAGLVPFAAAKLSGLRRLLLNHAGGAHELAELAGAAFLPRLSGLVLSSFSLAVPEITALFSKTKKLEELQLIDTRLGAAGVAALAELPSVERLRVLGVRHGRLGPSEATPLLRNTKLATRLEALDLRTNKLGGADTKVIGAGFPALRVLDLGNNPLDKDAIAKLVGGSGLRKLRVLALEKSSITDDMLGVLSKSPLLGQLRALDLRKNAVTDTGVAALLRAKDLSKLRTLHLGGNKLTAAGKKRLKEAKVLADTRLYL